MILSILFLILLLVLLFKLTGWVLHIAGKAVGILLSLIGYLIVGVLAVSVLGIAVFVLPIILIIAIIAILAGLGS